MARSLQDSPTHFYIQNNHHYSTENIFSVEMLPRMPDSEPRMPDSGHQMSNSWLSNTIPGPSDALN